MKTVAFKDIHIKDKNNLTYMVEMKATYEANTECDGNNDYDRICKKVETMEYNADMKAEKDAKAVIRKEDAAAKAQMKEDAKVAKADAKAHKTAEKAEVAFNAAAKAEFNDELLKKLIAMYEEIYIEQKVYYIVGDDKFHYKPEGSLEWFIASKVAYFIRERICSTLQEKALMVALGNMNKIFDKITYSFNPVASNILNKMTKDGWLTGNKDGIDNYHPAFDILMRGLAEDRQDVIDHISKVVAWKHRHPNDFTIPSLSIFGQSGGLGKNTFVDFVLRGIFGKDQVQVMSFSDIENFNGVMAGKTFIFLDELLSSKADVEKMKTMIGNRTITINPKGQKQYEADNTWTIISGGNDNIGAVLLSNTETDRRYSIIKSNVTVKEYTRQYLEGLGVDEVTNDEVRLVMAENLKVLDDKTHIDMWLGHILEKWKDEEMAPMAYHDQDYDDLLEYQKTPMEHFCETVFTSTDYPFDWIGKSVLYDAFKLFVDCHHAGYRNYVKNSLKFNKDVKMWLETKKLPISYKKLRVFLGKDDAYSTAINMFISDELDETSKDGEKRMNNIGQYIRKDKAGRNALNVQRFDDYVNDNPESKDNIFGIEKRLEDDITF